MSFHRLDLPAMHISAWDNLKDISDQNFVVVNVHDNELVNFDHFGTHPYLLELDVRRNRICNFLGLTRQVSLRTLHLSGNVIVQHPYYRIMALLVIGYSLESIDDVDVSEQQILLAKSIPSHAALAVSYGWLLDLQPRSPQSFQQIISDCQRIRAIHRRKCKGQFTIQHALKQLFQRDTFQGENITNNQVNKASSTLQPVKSGNCANKQQKQQFALKQSQLHGSNVVVDDNEDNKRTLHCDQQLHDAESQQPTSVCFTNAQMQTISCFQFNNVRVMRITKQKQKYTPDQWRRCTLQLSNTKVTIITQLQSYQPAFQFALCNLIVQQEQSIMLRIATEGTASVRLLFDSAAQMTAALKCIRTLQNRPILSFSSVQQQIHAFNKKNNNLPLQIQQAKQSNLLQAQQQTETVKSNKVYNAHNRESKIDQIQHANDDKSGVQQIEFEVEQQNQQHKVKDNALTNANNMQEDYTSHNQQNVKPVENGVDEILPCSYDNDNKNINDSTRRDIFATRVQTDIVNSKPNLFTIGDNNNTNINNEKTIKAQIEGVQHDKINEQNAKPNENGKRHSRTLKQIRHRKQKIPRSSVNAHSSSDSSEPSKQLNSTAITQLSSARIAPSANASHNNNNNATPLPAAPISLPRRAADKLKQSLPSSASSSFLAAFPAHEGNVQPTMQNTNITTTGNSGKVFDSDKTPQVPATRSLHNSFASSRCNLQKTPMLTKLSTSSTQLTDVQRKAIPIATNSNSINKNNTNTVNYEDVRNNVANNNNSNQLTNTDTPVAAVATTMQKKITHPHHQQLRHQEFRNIVVSSDSDSNM